jgi:hypothetical protein
MVRRTIMRDFSVVMAVATYRSKAAAQRDFDAVGSAKYEGELDHVAAAVLEKGADGTLAMDCHDSTATTVAWDGAVLGAALTVIAAPLGILFLANVVATRAAWLGVAALVGHFWHNIPKDELRRMSDLLEAGQAAVVVVGVDHTGEDLGALLSNAITTIVTDSTSADVEARLL